MRERNFRVQMVALIKGLKPTIGDDYRGNGCEGSKTPSMDVTIGADVNGWSYQTGDNSFTGGAYGYRQWATVTIDRRSNSRMVAEDIISQLMDDETIFPRNYDRIHWLVGRKVTAHNARGDGKVQGVVLKVEREEGRGVVCTLNSGYSVGMMDIVDTEPLPTSGFYVSTYCNKAHSLKTGRPLHHECRHIKPAALRLEMYDCFAESIEILQATKK